MQILINIHLRNSVQMFRIHSPCADQQAPRFLEYSICGLRIHRLARRRFAINVQHDWSAERDGRDNRVVSGAVFMRTDTLTGRVFIDEAVVRCLVRRVGKDVAAFARCGVCTGNGEQPGNYGIVKPWW